jgi:hypothetical protein
METKNRIYYTNPIQIPLFEEDDEGNLEEYK